MSVPLREYIPEEKESSRFDKVTRIFRCFRIWSGCKCHLLRRKIRIRMAKHSSALLIFFLFVIDTTFGSTTISTRRKRYYNAPVFPTNSEIEVAWEIGVPIGLEGKDVEVGLFLEADYSLPDNITYLYPDNFLDTYTGKRKRRLSRRRRSAGKRKGGPVTRQSAFIALETTMSSLGMDGHNCLLRSICESAETPLYHGSLVAELLHVLFTPSTTNDELDIEYTDAEKLGSSGGDCSKAYPSCPVGVFDMITTTEVDDDF